MSIYALPKRYLPADRKLRLHYSLIGLWALLMILIPLLRWHFADIGLWWGVMACVVLLATTVLVCLWRAWGLRQTARTAVLLLPATWLIEWIGSTTGFPFGEYTYTTALQPQLAHVPLVVPLAWLMMLPPAWAVASVITGANTGWRFVGISALAFTAWDFFLDPQMVGWGYWVWYPSGGYFGIPWVNFVGWVVSAALLTWIVRPPALPITPLVLIYTITWLLQTLGQWLFWAMPGPALVGFVTMGSFVALVWVRGVQRNAYSMMRNSA
jgi:lycopene beta-cyclase